MGTAFSLDTMRTLWAQFVEAKKLQRLAEAQVDEFTGALKQFSGGATEFTINKETVATLVPGQLNKSLLAKEQPDIVKQYTREVTREVFDEAAFRRDLPKIYEAYRAQRLVLKDLPD